MRHLALYGSVKILRDYCADCECYTFILDGKFACCDKPAVQKEPKGYKRMFRGGGERHSPTPGVRKRILQAQENRCFYCERLFGETYYLQGRFTKLSPQWDHLVPFAYLHSSPIANFVAACIDCNRVKKAMMFQTVEEARIYVRSRVFRV
jgi:hypothetical protein